MPGETGVTARDGDACLGVAASSWMPKGIGRGRKAGRKSAVGGTPQQINYFLTEAQILDLNGFSFQSNIN
jgi:hypothetical protein